MKNRIEVSAIGAHDTTGADGDEMKRKEPHIVLEILNDYCSTSTLHGVSYIGAKDKTLPEKIWWVIMFFLSVAACFFLISKTWTKWKENPVIISFEKEQIQIWKIPFPAVTICPINKVDQTKFNYTDYYRNRNKLNDKHSYKVFSDLSLVCNPLQLGKVFNSTIKFTDELAIDCIREAAPNDIVLAALWQNLELNATFFTEHLTEEGLCFSFNTLSQDDMFTDQLNEKTNYIDHDFMNEGWNIEDGYLPELDMGSYPLRTARDGRISGLSIYLKSKSYEIDYVCGLPVSGYKVTLHSPSETPKVSEQYFLVPFNKLVSIIVRPELTKTEKNVRSLPPHTRKCYFSNEKSLKFFKVYTQNNCRVECDANITLHYCGCVPFHMPRDNKTKICGYGNNICMLEIESAILDFEVKEKLATEIFGESREKLENTREIFSQCDCLPSCSSLQYTAETSQSETHLVKTYLASEDGSISPEQRRDLEAGVLIVSQVDIFFKEPQFLALQRSELYGQTDFLANCGGLLGLFMGFSLLSLLEIVYFLTIRLWFKYQIRRKHKM